MDIVAFLARGHGLSGLEALLQSDYHVVALVTHRLLPKSEDSTRCERPEFAQYKSIAAHHNIPLYTIDSKAEQDLVLNALESRHFDFVASISWRRLIPNGVLKQATFGGVNVHRGKLPDYPGAEPIKQALQHGDKKIVVTAHQMTEVIDAGEILATSTHSVNYDTSQSLDANVARLKDEITSCFGPLLLQGLDRSRRLQASLPG